MDNDCFAPAAPPAGGLGYGPATPPPPGRRSTALGKVLTVLAAVFGPPAAAVAAFVGLVTWSDCFIGCGGHPNRLAGGLLVALAVALLLAGPVLAGLLVRRWAWVVGACAVPVIEALLLAGVLG